MFAIGIRFLCGWSMATHPANRSQPEWPPHPDRVFMALAAAHFETERDPSERSALEWLESLQPPAIWASGYEPRKTVTTFVPVNDTASPMKGSGKTARPLMALQSIPLGRDRQPRQFPVAVPHSEHVWLIWNVPVDTDQHLATLGTLCGKVSYLGHSASLVQMWVDRKPPTPTIMPSKDRTRLRLRITGPGRLRYLEDCFNEKSILDFQFLAQQVVTATGKQKADLKKRIKETYNDIPPVTLRPTPGLWSGYSPIEPPVNRGSEVSGSEFQEDLIVFSCTKGRRLGLESTLRVTDALRGALMKLCPEPIPEWLCGHKPDRTKSERTHVSILPLPHVGRKHADGHLLGLALAIPKGIHPDEVAHCLGGLFADDANGETVKTVLTMGRLGEWLIQPERRESPPSTLRQNTWTAQSRSWATVTPIILDRYPKADGDAEKAIAKACRRIGLPEPEDVV